jgi:anhydro-N-acetylmuramic acid kinase
MKEEQGFIDVLGIMSGTSLDGLDIAYCRFEENNGLFSGNILYAETIFYPEEWKLKLSHAHQLSALDFLYLHNDFGSYIGKEINRFLKKYDVKPLCISSHGHTVFHNPSHGLTCQIGNGAVIAAETGFNVVCDFRTSDVALGGEGAPLVPFGDIQLFAQYDAALNLGGFSNITILNAEKPTAFDICPVNIILNTFAKKEGFEYDHNGRMASEGNIIKNLLDTLESLEIYSSSSQKSLSREWVDSTIMPLINTTAYTTMDILRTITEHISLRIANILNSYALKNCLVTGGGVYNTFLIERIQSQTQTELIIPDDHLVQFKEALIFAFLGLKRLNNEVNVLSDITHARKSSSSGIIWKGC